MAAMQEVINESQKWWLAKRNEKGVEVLKAKVSSSRVSRATDVSTFAEGPRVATVGYIV